MVVIYVACSNDHLLCYTIYKGLRSTYKSDGPPYIENGILVINEQTLEGNENVVSSLLIIVNGSRDTLTFLQYFLVILKVSLQNY